MSHPPISTRLPSLPAAAVGIGLRLPHARELMARRPAIDFVEVHSENHFAAGGAARAVLTEVRTRYPVSLHGVGLGLGSAAGLDPWHLDRLAALVQRIEPVRVSDHAAFARVATPRRGALDGEVVHVNDLLPVARTGASLDILVAQVQQVQERLRRPILVENLSAYLGWADDLIPEPDFFNALTRRSGCGLLLDVNNLVVNALNAGCDAAGAVAQTCAWIDRVDAHSVGELHLAGYCDTGDIVIDDHGSRVHPPVWLAYAHARSRLPTVPVLIEWDTDLPALDVLLDEAERARTLTPCRYVKAVL